MLCFIILFINIIPHIENTYIILLNNVYIGFE